MKKLFSEANGAKLRLAARRADLIRNAIKDSVDVNKIMEAWTHTHFTDTVTPAQAREWAQVHIYFDKKPLNKALETIYAEGYVLGEQMAFAALAKIRLNKSAPTLNQMRGAIGTPWKTWTPGNKAAARLLNPPNGLKNLLQSRGVTIDGMSKTTLDRIGSILAKALKEGASPRSTVASLLDVLPKPTEARAQVLQALGYSEVDSMLSDPERALMIAQTEMSRAVSVANRELYLDSGVELVEWLTADPCDECQENQDVSPISIEDTFPSGDTEPPAHPNCVCDLAPYVVDTQNIGEDALALTLD